MLVWSSIPSPPSPPHGGHGGGHGRRSENTKTYEFRYFENQGSRTSPSYVVLSGTDSPIATIDIGTEPATVFMYDVDNSGTMDLIMGGGDPSASVNRIKYFLNINTATGTAGYKPTWQELNEDYNPFIEFSVVSKNIHPILADVDGNGLVDLIFGDGFGYVHWSPNSGTLSNVQFVKVTDSTSGSFPSPLYHIWSNGRRTGGQCHSS